MMDEWTRDRLHAIGMAEQFEKWLEEHDDGIYRLIHMTVEQWTPDDVLSAQAALATQRAILLAEKLKRTERQQAGT